MDPKKTGGTETQEKPLDQMSEQELRDTLAKERGERESLQKERDEYKQAQAQAEEEAAERERKAAAQSQAGSQGMTEEQWQALEEKYGMDRKQLQATFDMAALHTAPLRTENQQLKAQIAAKDNVETALNKARSDDRQFGKYETHVRTYLDRVPLEDKADPKKLAAHMDIAIKFGRGSVPQATINDPRRGGNDMHRHLDTQEPDDAKSKGKDMYGQEHVGDASMKGTRIDLDERVSAEYRERHTQEHADGGIDVRVRQRDEWRKAEQERLKRGGK